MPEQKNFKRLFFGWSVEAPWPDKLPSARILTEDVRHTTLAFLGKTDYEALVEVLSDLPRYTGKLGPVGIFDRIKFLPRSKSPNVVAWHVAWLEQEEALLAFQKEFSDFLRLGSFAKEPPNRRWLPHVTLGRKPFNFKEWRQAFHPLPLMVTGLHLYESLGNATYEKIWSDSLLAPLERMEHTADAAYRVRGSNLAQLSLHAEIALAFEAPEVLAYREETESPKDLLDIIAHLNALVTRTDVKVGCGLKAVSYHGEIQERENGVLEWEMIIDV